MMDELSKNAYKYACYAYENYLDSTKRGKRMSQAKTINFEVSTTFKSFDKFHPDDLKEVIAELAKAGYGEMAMEGNFFMSDKMIAWMEKRFKRGLLEVIDFISKFT